MTKKITVLFLIITVLSGVWAEQALLTDTHEILKKMEEAMSFDTVKLTATLENIDSMGSTTTEFDTWENNKNTLLHVTSGPDRGQKILRLEDIIYIYYPSAEEVIRLSSSGLKNSFLGSDFSYEDLTGKDDYDERYDSTLIGTTIYDGKLCYEILLKAKKSSETYQIESVFIDTELFIPLKFVLFSKSGKTMKTLYYMDWINTNGTYFPGKILVENNIKKNKSSLMTVTDIVFDIEINSSIFSKEELQW